MVSLIKLAEKQNSSRRIKHFQFCIVARETCHREILYLEVNESRVCSKRPLCVEENVSFVVNRSVLKNTKDWLINDNSSFKNLGNSFKVFGMENAKVSITSLSFIPLQSSTTFVNVCLCLLIFFFFGFILI